MLCWLYCAVKATSNFSISAFPPTAGLAFEGPAVGGGGGGGPLGPEPAEYLVVVEGIKPA
jgi:hypothetical protein